MSLPGNWTLEEIVELSYYKGINSILHKEIIETYSSLGEFLNAGDRNFKFDKFRQNSLFAASRDAAINSATVHIEECEKNEVDIITYWSDYYPALLKEIYYAPVMIYVKGDLQPADSQSLSIVGTRQCTMYGKLTAERFAAAFANNNIIVTSGMAYGIDTAAHNAAIESGGITYAVIACGIDSIMPADAAKKAQRIVDSGGAIISEHKCGVKALPGYFPQRNRIISGISRATLVVESAMKGGALITAKFALNQSRDVFAVPGNITSEKSKGTNLLIKLSEAIPAISPESMLEDLGLNSKNGLFEKSSLKFNDKDEEKIFNVVNHEPLHIDRIAEVASLEISLIMVKLLDMEFRGLVRRLPGNNYIRS